MLLFTLQTSNKAFHRLFCPILPSTTIKYIKALQGCHWHVFISNVSTHLQLLTGEDCSHASPVFIPSPPSCLWRMWLCIVCLKDTWMSMQKMWSWRQHYAGLKILVYFSVLMLPSQNCKWSLPRALIKLHSIIEPAFYTLNLVLLSAIWSRLTKRWKHTHSFIQ